MSIYDWKFDPYRSGYVHRETGAFVPQELLQRSGIAYRSLQIARSQGAFAALQFTADQIEALAASLKAQEQAAQLVPCGVCEGAGVFRHGFIFVDCCLCGGTGRFRSTAEREP